jgi:hypothetical protein
MMQTPGPPVDPNVIINGLIPIFGMFTGIVITGFVALGPVGRAIGDGIRHVFGARKDGGALGQADVDEIVGRLDAIQQHLGELAERQDFAERMLAQVRKDRALAGGTDVAG